MIRVVMDTSSLISLGLINALGIASKNIKIIIPSTVRSELNEISLHDDRKGVGRKKQSLSQHAKNAISLTHKEIGVVGVNDSKMVEGLLSKDVNRGEAECFVCCIENKIKILVMDDIDAAYRLEGHAIANGIKIRTSVAVLVHLRRQGVISQSELEKYVRELIKTRGWEGGALEILAGRYIGKPSRT